MPRSLQGRAQLAIATLWLVVAAAIADSYAHAHRLALVQDAIDSTLPGVPLLLPGDAVDHANRLVTTSRIASAAMLVIATVAWSLWQLRAGSPVATIRAARRGARVTLVAAAAATVGAVALRIAGARGTQSLVDQRLPDGLTVAGDALTVAAALLAIGVVRHVSEAAMNAAAEAQAASA